MADFPKDYFQAETREGFHIEAMMKCAWAAQIEVLEILDSVCAKYGLRYFAADGTLLGVVRHKGFIPWDDDVDIYMFRDDYNRLLRVPTSEWPDGFALHSIYENTLHSQPFGRIVNSDKIDYSPEHLSRFHGCPYSVGTDIFPLDTLSDSQSETQIQCELLRIVMQVYQMYKQSPDATMELLPDIESLCHIRFDRKRSIQNQLLQIIESLSQLYNDTAGAGTAYMITYVEHGTCMKKEWFAETLRMPFETITLPIPVGYHQILTALYGDYMVPVRGTQDHDYPFYKKQERILMECMLKERNYSTHYYDNK
ncbi:MAG: LicD family protein [Lachnospiraceae bacterium]|nr:LicD family protein [Lachnospiraceae bacterium]MDD7628678.1 LicD family protein [Lachnospiraceae bacterium]MDY4118638.1 LicD family protein [Lachnospiraceae bacterium]